MQMQTVTLVAQASYTLWRHFTRQGEEDVEERKGTVICVTPWGRGSGNGGRGTRTGSVFSHDVSPFRDEKGPKKFFRACGPEKMGP